MEVHHAPSAVPIPQILYTMKGSNFHAEALDPKSSASDRFRQFRILCEIRDSNPYKSFDLLLLKQLRLNHLRQSRNSGPEGIRTLTPITGPQIFLGLGQPLDHVISMSF